MTRTRAALAALALLAATVTACVHGPVAGNATGASGGGGAAADVHMQPRWIEVSQPRPIDPQFGAVPYPGIAIGQHQTDGSTQDCTLGPAVTTPAGPAFATAGHCDPSPDGGVFVFADAAATVPVPVGVLADASPSEAAAEDHALLPNAAAANVNAIAGHPVAGVMSEANVKVLPVGTPICTDAAWSGVSCGAGHPQGRHPTWRLW